MCSLGSGFPGGASEVRTPLRDPPTASPRLHARPLRHGPSWAEGYQHEISPSGDERSASGSQYQWGSTMEPAHGPRPYSQADMGAICRSHRARIYRFCCRLCGNVDDAEDLTQDTFVLAHRAIGSFEGRAWLCRIALRFGRRSTSDHWYGRTTDPLKLSSPTSALVCAGGTPSTSSLGPNYPCSTLRLR